MKTTAATLALALLVLVGAVAHPGAQQPPTILITGSNRGLGLEFATQYAAAGWNVIATARDVTGAKALRELAARHPRVTLERLDLLDRAGIEALAAKYRGRPMTSRSGIISQPGYRGPYFYRASKIGLNMVTRVLADDLRGKGIVVATISPPPTETDVLRALIGPENAARQAKPADVLARLMKVIDGLTQASSAEPTYLDGTKLPW